MKTQEQKNLINHIVNSDTDRIAAVTLDPAQMFAAAGLISMGYMTVKGDYFHLTEMADELMDFHDMAEVMAWALAHNLQPLGDDPGYEGIEGYGMIAVDTEGNQLVLDAHDNVISFEFYDTDGDRMAFGYLHS